MTTVMKSEASLDTFGNLRIGWVKDIALSRGWCGIIYGPPGVGKTTLGGTAAGHFDSDTKEFIKSQYGYPVFDFDVEGGSGVIKDIPGIQTPGEPISSYKQVKSFMNALIQTPVDQIPWKTIMFDNLSEI